MPEVIKEIQELLIDEMQERYAKCMGGRDAPTDLSMQEIVEQMGREEFLEALMSGASIRRCKNCGRPFAAYRRGECYCNRIAKDDRTCKEVGAAEARKNDPVNDALDKARRLHLYRKAKAGKTKAARKRYMEWDMFARECADRCRNGEIDLEEMKTLIGREYTKDKNERRL